MECRKCAALQAEIDRLHGVIARMRQEHNEDMRESARDARDAVAEARWEVRQGEDYGSF
jgi:hypothetical protein